jgi:hypothetical protein
MRGQGEYVPIVGPGDPRGHLLPGKCFRPPPHTIIRLPAWHNDSYILQKMIEVHEVLLDFDVI